MALSLPLVIFINIVKISMLRYVELIITFATLFIAPIDIFNRVGANFGVLFYLKENVFYF